MKRPLLTLSAIILAGLVAAPILEALMLYAMYGWFGSVLGDQTAERRSLIGLLVFGATTLAFYASSQNAVGGAVVPWNWLRARTLGFLITITAFEALKLGLTWNHAFNRRGEPQLFFVVRGNGDTIVSDRGDSDPVTGLLFERITADNRDWVEAMRRHGRKLPKAADPAAHEWFLPGGEAALFFTEADGKMEFFNRPGYHPSTRERILPVTQALRARWETARERARAAAAHAEAEALATRKRAEAEALARKRAEVESANAQKKAEAEARAARDRAEAERQAAMYRQREQERLAVDARQRDAEQLRLKTNASAARRAEPAAPFLSPQKQDSLVMRSQSVRTAPAPPVLCQTTPTIVPLHFNCGHRHWPSQPCPQYQLTYPQPRILAPRAYIPRNHYRYVPRCRQSVRIVTIR